MPAPRCLERLKDQTEHRLRNYSIIPIGCRWVVIRAYEFHGDHAERAFTTRNEAEDYLFARLPKIAEPRDIIRTPRP